MKNLLVYVLWPVIAGLLFAGGVLLGTGNLPGLRQTPDQDNQPASPSFNDFEFTFREAVQKSLPAIVTINSSVAFDSNSYEIPSFTSNNQSDVEKSQGTGIIISPDGYIVTNLHIFQIFNDGMVEDRELTATLSDGRTLPIREVGRYDEDEGDLTLLKIDSDNEFPYLSMGDPRPLSVGDFVLAIGNPRNLGQSVSLGIISALHKINDSYVIQTDAAINPGNSGGALLDYEGNLIGITSRIISESGGFEGISFAIPADYAFRLLNEYLETSTIAYLGVETGQLVQVRSQLSVRSALPVLFVSENSPASRAGIVPGDLILSINNVVVDSFEEARNILVAISELDPGQEVEIGLVRNQVYLTVTAVLGERRPCLRCDPVDTD